jgi:hypothetical protein
MKPSVTQWLLGMSLACVVGCAAEVEDDMLDYDTDGVALLSQRLASAADIAHACGHARNPPANTYLPTTATAAASNASPLWAEHAAYDMTLPGSGGTFAGWGRYTADGTAEHGIYTDPSTSVTVRIRNANGSLGAQLSQVWTTTISAATCPASTVPGLPSYGTTAALSRVRTFNLSAGQTYYVRFSNSSSKMLGLFENLDEL